MKNFVQPGDIVTLTMPYARLSGQGVLVGATFGVVAADYAVSTSGEVRIGGVVDLNKAAGAVTQGQLLYWDDAARAVTTTAAGNTKIGVAMLPAAAGATVVRVRLNGAF